MTGFCLETELAFAIEVAEEELEDGLGPVGIGLPLPCFGDPDGDDPEPVAYPFPLLFVVDFEDENDLVTLFEENGYTCSVGTQFAEDHFYEFKESFKNVLTKQISPLRIGSIYLDFHIDRISARVEFFERPPLEKSFQIRDAKVKVDNPKLTSGGIIAKSIDECLKTQLKENYFKEILYCPSLNGLCLNIEDPNSLEETVDSNIDCKLYYFPLMNQYRLTKEIELADIHKSSLRLDNMPISLKCDNCTTASKSHRYRITNVLDYTFFDQISHKQSSFMEIQKSSKLISTDKSVHPVSGAIHSIGDCYRTCVTPNNFDCVAFSYCSNGNSHECLISSALFIPNATVYANNCSTYSRNFLLEYQKNPNQQFYDISDDDSVYSWTVEDCAAQCSQSPKCFSFQYCSNNNQCTFTKTSYPVKKVRHDIFCNVYTPKKSQEFVSTGTTLVSEFILSESKLNMEQCAALCYNWRAGNESCKSFNFCPKGRLETTCQLTQYMVGNPNVATSPSQNCYNFQLLKKLQQRESNHEAFAPNDDMANAATSISLAFLVVGLALGIATTSIYHMIHNRHKYRVTTVHQEQDLDS
ncbi:uncharacterized protein LOC128394866 [Panonychus citri]|uniref:uncharacterized protein LOC128394866 n=1 Tax=Panonychus citri TaxID=50023 RepID=UPI0023077852|nr:uncharacterized protein LOC128394866 [Panonychus citri]